MCEVKGESTQFVLTLPFNEDRFESVCVAVSAVYFLVVSIKVIPRKRQSVDEQFDHVTVCTRDFRNSEEAKKTRTPFPGSRVQRRRVL